MKSGKRKIRVGDWVLAGGHAFQAHDVTDRFVVFRRGDMDEAFPLSGVTRLPASPSDMAKSHRLLTAYAKGLSRCARWMLSDREVAVLAHCNRLTTKKSRAAGKGHRHGTI